MSSTATSLMPTPARTSINSAISTVSKALPTPMQTAPSTPTVQKPEAKPSPGTFRHPRLAEIIQRQNKTLLTQSNVKSAAINAGALLLSFAFSKPIHSIIITFLSLLFSRPTAIDTATTLMYASQTLFVINTILSLRQRIPYLARQDSLDDIPLTPSQRALLGLPASANTTTARTGSPLAPSTGYITPPRYHRRLSSNSNSPSSPTGTPDAARSADRRSISANYSASPLSTSRHTLGFSPSPTAPQTQPYNRSTNVVTAPFSPSGSPLFHKAIGRQQRRQSQSDFRESSSPGVFRDSTGLSRSHSVRDDGMGGRGPAAATAARKGVNFKWLYDQEYNLVGPGGGNGGNGTSVGPGARGLASSQSMHF